MIKSTHCVHNIYKCLIIIIIYSQYSFYFFRQKHKAKTTLEFKYSVDIKQGGLMFVRVNEVRDGPH